MPGEVKTESASALNERILEPITEAELKAKAYITPEDVLRLNKITEGTTNIIWPCSSLIGLQIFS